MKIVEAGTELDATFSVENVDGQLRLTVESRGGARGAPNERNTQYDDGLRVLLARLGDRNAEITDALVTSATSLRKYPADEERRVRTEHDFPIRVADHDPDMLRRAFGRAMRKAARDPVLTSSGNNNKRVTFSINVPGANVVEELAAYLRTGLNGSAPKAPENTEHAWSPATISNAGSPASTSPRRQGYMADARKRKAIEDRAMALARDAYEDLGFAVTDVSGNNPYDLHCTHPDGSEVRVEVKGTTGSGDTIQLTVGEVKHAQRYKGNVALFVVSGIGIEDGPNGPVGHGGAVTWTKTWDVESGTLTATRFDWTAPGLTVEG